MSRICAELTGGVPNDGRCGRPGAAERPGVAVDGGGEMALLGMGAAPFVGCWCELGRLCVGGAWMVEGAWVYCNSCFIPPLVVYECLGKPLPFAPPWDLLMSHSSPTSSPRETPPAAT